MDESKFSQVIVGIPAYNASKNISKVIENAKKYCFKVIVCDDGSLDDTFRVAKQAGANVIRHNKNQGYGAALKSLFDYAKKENPIVFVTIDADGQHDAEDIPKLIKPIINGKVDFVTGSRFMNLESKNEIPKYRLIGIKTITKMSETLSKSGITDSQCGFRAYGRNALDKIQIFETGMSASTEILMSAKKNNLRISEVPILVRYDVNNSSTHNPFSHGIAVLSSIFRYISVKHPLSFYSLPGAVLVLISIIFMGWALELFSETRFVSTNMIVISIGSALVGIVLIATGTILYTMTVLIRENMKIDK